MSYTPYNVSVSLCIHNNYVRENFITLYPLFRSIEGILYIAYYLDLAVGDQSNADNHSSRCYSLHSRYNTRRSNICIKLAKTPGWSTLQIQYKTVKYMQKRSIHTRLVYTPDTLQDSQIYAEN